MCDVIMYCDVNTCQASVGHWKQPITGSSLFCEISQLPSKLFNTYTSRDSYELDEMDPNHNTSFNSTMGRLFSTCRHSLRLLNNGYYILDEDSVLCSAEGNITFSPTKPNVSYKENVVRIFRHRRRSVAPRRLNLWNKEIQPQESGLEDDNNWNRQEVESQDNHIFSPKPTRWNRRTLTVVLFCMCLFISLLARFWMESWLST
uniref:Uncharacterized protein n=1 Tax=Leptobrachium leishanense TaxID=445787 RepID=A0A8C5MVK8_9ANUR